MDSLSTFLKENYDMVTLLLGVLGVVIAFITLVYEIKKKKSDKKKQL